MSVAELKIHDLRNFSSLNLTLHPKYNVVCGPNGSGKTSVLEALYILTNGNSFRTRDKKALIKYTMPELALFMRTSLGETVSIKKTSTGSTHAQINQQACLRSSDLARFLPCQLFHYDIFNIIDSGPTIRRQLLDWGLFHVEPSYALLWQNYRHTLNQRNALLRQRAPVQHVMPWDQILTNLATQLDTLRQNYIQQWEPLFQKFLSSLTNTTCSLQYYKGWDKKQRNLTLQDALQTQWHSDCQRQYTQSGPHQADLLLDNDGMQSKKTHSRGQQKIILIALKLAQAQLLKRECVYLFDDLSAELDMLHLQRLFSCLQSISGQFFFTNLTAQQFQDMLPTYYEFMLNSIS